MQAPISTPDKHGHPGEHITRQTSGEIDLGRAREMVPKSSPSQAHVEKRVVHPLEQHDPLPLLCHPGHHLKKQGSQKKQTPEDAVKGFLPIFPQLTGSSRIRRKNVVVGNVVLAQDAKSGRVPKWKVHVPTAALWPVCACIGWNIADTGCTVKRSAVILNSSLVRPEKARERARERGKARDVQNCTMARRIV